MLSVCSYSMFIKCPCHAKVPWGDMEIWEWLMFSKSFCWGGNKYIVKKWYTCIIELLIMAFILVLKKYNRSIVVINVNMCGKYVVISIFQGQFSNFSFTYNTDYIIIKSWHLKVLHNSWESRFGVSQPSCWIPTLSPYPWKLSFLICEIRINASLRAGKFKWEICKGYPAIPIASIQ